MATAADQVIIDRLRESRPPATDSFTYLTIVEKSLSPAVLPALHDILLEDAALTRDIGWDLVEILITVPGSEKCLETVARLGNPREVILKVLAAVQRVTAQVARGEEDEEADEEGGGEVEEWGGEAGGGAGEEASREAGEEAEREAGEGSETAADGGDRAGEREKDPIDRKTAAGQFATLVGMLAVLHRRLMVRSPARFLHATVQTLARAYPFHAAASAAPTAAVIQLARSLSGLERPPLPTRKSSLKASLSAFPDPNSGESAADPEADAERKGGGGGDGSGSGSGDRASGRNRTAAPRAGAVEVEAELVAGLLRVFVTCVVEGFVNARPVEWASRLLEFYHPERIVPGRQTVMAAFREDEELHLRDAMMGELAAIAADVGLGVIDARRIRSMCESDVVKDPFATEPDFSDPNSIPLSSAGFWCLFAYRLFASELFDAHHEPPDMHIFPDHATLLKRFLGDSPLSPISSSPGTAEALLAIGLWLESNDRLEAAGTPIPDKTTQQQTGSSGTGSYMQYHHLLTLIAAFHPSLSVRNAATSLAGAVLHRDPDEGDRLRVLEDLLECCMFSSLQACAVTWLREEFLHAATALSGSAPAPPRASRFATSEPLEVLQYVLFPDLTSLAGVDADADGAAAAAAAADYFASNAPFLLQAANLAVFLLGASSSFRHLVPAGMAAAVESRYVEPLLRAAATMTAEGASTGGGGGGEMAMQVAVLMDRLRSLSL